MPKPRKSAEEVCIEYANAAFHVRLADAALRQNPCEVVKEWCDGTQKLPQPQNCLALYFTLHTYNAGNDTYGEEREVERDEMCESCQERLRAIERRKVDRKRFGAAKRSVEAVGKRLQKEANHE